jgi:hypothetical protein
VSADPGTTWSVEVDGKRKGDPEDSLYVAERMAEQHVKTGAYVTVTKHAPGKPSRVVARWRDGDKISRRGR